MQNILKTFVVNLKIRKNRESFSLRMFCRIPYIIFQYLMAIGSLLSPSCYIEWMHCNTIIVHYILYVDMYINFIIQLPVSIILHNVLQSLTASQLITKINTDIDAVNTYYSKSKSHNYNLLIVHHPYIVKIRIFVAWDHKLLRIWLWS